MAKSHVSYYSIIREVASSNLATVILLMMIVLRKDKRLIILQVIPCQEV